MTVKSLRSLTLLAGLALALPALAATKDEVTKPLKALVGNVRYERDTAALKQFAAEAQGQYLMGADWQKGTPAQRQEFTRLFQSVFAKKAFPQIRDNFKYLASVTYGEPKVEGAQASADSTVLINHPLKKQEFKLKYALAQEAGGWKVVDVKVLGDSMLDSAKVQIDELKKEGGWEAVLKALRDLDASLKGVKLK